MCLSKSPNKHNRLFVKAVPMPDGLAEEDKERKNERDNQESGDGYVLVTDLTEFLDEAHTSEGPLADPMHVENYGRGAREPIDENHVGDHMVRGPGDPRKHIDAVFIDQGKDRGG